MSSTEETAEGSDVDVVCALTAALQKLMEAELRDDNLFRQPDGTHFGECPICFLPMPLDPQKITFKPCCGKMICLGCVCSSVVINKHDFEKTISCPFCRKPTTGEKENLKRMMERVKANDPVALREMGTARLGEGDWDTAFEYWTKAAELGDHDAHYQLGVMYKKGGGVAKDEEKGVYHYEKAAIGGHPYARHNLGCVEHENGNMERAVKHYIIAANLGFELSMKALWKHYSLGNITKENLETTLRTHKAAIDEMKSPEREAGYKLWISRVGP
jgi:tetratricopeptide (TPR) repeat protein